MQKKQLLVLVLLLCGQIFNVQAQKIPLSRTQETFLTWQQTGDTVMDFRITIDELSFSKVDVEGHSYALPHIENLVNSNTPGKPLLPVLRHLIEIPLSAEVEIVIKSVEQQSFFLQDHNVVLPLKPAQPSYAKSASEKDIVFVKDSMAYTLDSFVEKPLLSFDTLGVMRSARLGRLTFAPLSYNPVTQKIKIVHSVNFQLVFKDADFEATKGLKARTYSPFFRSAYQPILNYEEVKTKSNQTQYPVKFVIVSDSIFESTLQPFVEWKTQKGFEVIEAYTNNPAVGHTNNSIKSYLENLYNSATPTDPAFSFVLLVGDIAQIPSFPGTTGSHVTDFYYGEFTGDFLPDVYYGRFSANNIAELQPQIDKTLMYEQYFMPSTSFLEKSLLVAGNDANFGPVHGNGHINYLTDHYFNSNQNITALAYLYPASVSASTQILQDFNNGTAIVNYTAHCNTSGWSGPSFTTSHVSGLTNAGRYPVMIGNCCSSASFDVYNSFAEAVLRAPESGAVGYIGGSNLTYWDEDYWWAVGYKNISVNPTYAPGSLGAFDRLFHTHGEGFSEWFTTQGQIITAGNLAVTQSNSSRSDYYWEIYHLMGDPSLTPYLYEPPPLAISYPAAIVAGTSSLIINTEPYTYIGLSKNGVLHGAGLSDASGYLLLNYQAFSTPGVAKLVATKQNRQPYIADIDIIIPNGPYLTYSSHTINDSHGNNNGVADYGEFILLNLDVENVGNQAASNVSTELSTADPYITILDSLHQWGTINSGQVASDTSVFSFLIADDIKDHHQVLFNLTFKDINDSTWHSFFHIALHAPVFGINSVAIKNGVSGNNGTIDPGETADMEVNFSNTGGAAAYDVEAVLTPISSQVTVNSGFAEVDTLNAGESYDALFNITVDSGLFMGAQLMFLCEITAGQYLFTDTIVITVGEIPELFMKDTVLSTCMLYFYDSGGPDNNYSNDEDYVVTFLPALPQSFIKATFFSFSVEENTWDGDCWDELYVFDGSTTNAPLIGVFCGEDIPGPFMATNPDGALTFRFVSDFSVNQQGWEALVECLPLNIAQTTDEPFTYKLFPNPSQGIFYLNTENNSQNIYQIKIFNLKGQKVYNRKKTARDFPAIIDLSGVSKGIYLMQIHHDKGIVNEKIIIQ